MFKCSFCAFLILLLLYFSLVWGQLELDFIGAKGAYGSLFILCTVSTVTKINKMGGVHFIIIIIAQVHKPRLSLFLGNNIISKSSESSE